MPARKHGIREAFFFCYERIEHMAEDLPQDDLPVEDVESVSHTQDAEDQSAGRKRLVSRISMSLSEDLLSELDAMVGERGFASRSQAVSTILHRSLVEHRHQVGDRVMVGTITLFYDHLAVDLQQKLANLQRQHIDEVIASLHVHLMHNKTLEVVLVQGPAQKLQTIADLMITERGVISGHLELVAALMPQLHPFRSEIP